MQPERPLGRLGTGLDQSPRIEDAYRREAAEEARMPTHPGPY